MRAFSEYLREDMKELNIGVTLIAPGEITDSEYFKDTPGKAGSVSKSRIPAIMQLGILQKLNGTSAQCAVAGLQAIEDGLESSTFPQIVNYPLLSILHIFPDFVKYLCSWGSNGLRKAV